MDTRQCAFLKRERACHRCPLLRQLAAQLSTLAFSPAMRGSETSAIVLAVWRSQWALEQHASETGVPEAVLKWSGHAKMEPVLWQGLGLCCLLDENRAMGVQDEPLEGYGSMYCLSAQLLP